MSEPVKTLCLVEILGVSATPFSKYNTKNLETETAIKRKRAIAHAPSPSSAVYPIRFVSLNTVG
jgi:hypothetical protein